MWQPCKFFQPNRQKMPLIFNGLTRLWFRIRNIFSIYFLSQNASQWDISSQASARSFNRNIRKASSITIQVSMALFSFKKGVRPKKKIQKSLYFILKRDLLKIYAVLNEFLVNYRSRTCASEKAGSLRCFASFLSFSAKQFVSDAYLRIRENPGAWCPNVHYSLIAAVEEELLSRSLITPEKTCKRDGVKLFPLDCSILEFWRPANQWPAYWVGMFPCRWCQWGYLKNHVGRGSYKFIGDQGMPTWEAT